MDPRIVQNVLSRLGQFIAPKVQQAPQAVGQAFSNFGTQVHNFQPPQFQAPQVPHFQAPNFQMPQPPRFQVPQFNFNQTVQQIRRPVPPPIQLSQPVQSFISNLRQPTPPPLQVIGNHQFVPGGKTLNQIGQDIQRNPNNYNLYAQMGAGNLRSGIKPLDQTGQFAGQFINNRMVTPAVQTGQDLFKAVNANNGENLKQRTANLITAGFHGLSVTPMGIVFNTAIQAPADTITGGLYANRTGKSIAQGAISGASGRQSVPLGTALTSNPVGQTVGNIVEIPFTLIASNPKQVAKLTGRSIQEIKALAQNPDFRQALAEQKGFIRIPGKQAAQNIEQNVTKDVHGNIIPHNAIWHSPTGGDIPIKVTGTLGTDKTGESYFSIFGSKAGIPKSQIEFINSQATEGVKLLPGGTEPLNVKQALRVFKKTGNAPDFVNQLKPNENPINVVPGGFSNAKIYQEGKPVSEAKAINDWEQQIKKQTTSLGDYVANKKQAFNQEFDQLNQTLGGTKAYKGGTNPELTTNFPAKALESTAVKDKAPFSYQRETLLRNIENTFKNPQNAQAVKDYFHNPIVQNETASTNYQSQLYKSLSDTFKKAGISKGSKEDYAAADFIEGNTTLADLKKQFPNKWQGIVSAANTGRSVYKDLLGKINGEITKFGYAPINERQNYVTHTAQIDQLLNKFGSFLNINKDKLPTEMSAINVETKPGRQFFRFGLQRQGGSTHEGLITALEKYIPSASRQIYHTADIQRGRALLHFLQNSAGAQDSKLSNFNSFLGQYVNHLAGKANIIDRPIEKVFGRGLLTVGDKLRSRTGANMVGGNVSSALTNFIPFTQSVAATSKPAFVKGLYEAAISPGRALNEIDGVQSSFLTRRFPTDNIDTSFGQKAGSALNWLFRTVDQFTSKSVVAGKYFEGLQQGLGKAQAMTRADEFAARVMADRSFGQTPLLFNSKTLGALTQFQLEVNNQMSYFLKDIPQNLGYNKAQVAAVLGQAVLYSYLFNNMFEKVTGRRPQIDPLHAALSTIQGIQQGKGIKELANPVDQNSPVGEIAQNLPFASILTGGRIPIGSAIPNPFNVIAGTSTPQAEAKKLAFGLLSPTGGNQLKKTIEGVQAYKQGYSATDKGQVRFPIAQTGANLARNALFGQYATPEANQYFNNNGKPLSDNQSQLFKLSDTQGKQKLYSDLINNRQQDQQIKKIKDQLASGDSAFPPASIVNANEIGNSQTPQGQNTFTIGGQSINGYVVGNKFIYQDPDTGDVTTKSISSIQKAQQADKRAISDSQYTLDAQRLQRAGDVSGWLNTTQNQIKSLQDYQATLNPTSDKAKINELQNKIEDLQTSLNKYSSYGGFTKPKKPKKLRITSRKAPAFKTPKSAKVKTSKLKIKPIKLSLSPLGAANAQKIKPLKVKKIK